MMSHADADKKRVHQKGACSDDTLAIINTPKNSNAGCYNARLNFYREFMAFEDRNDPDERRSL